MRNTAVLLTSSVHLRGYGRMLNFFTVVADELRYARVRNDPYKVINFPVYFESTSRNGMQQVTVAVWIPTE